MVIALAVVHPPEVSGLHTFWAARWSALRRSGVEVHLALPKNVDPPALRSIPGEYVHHVRYGRPRAASHVLSNLGYLGRLRGDSDRLAAVANQVGASTVISHGPHLLTPALLARRYPRHHLLLLHSDSAPRWTAAAMRWVRKPDQVLAETKAAEAAYCSALGVAHSSTLLPAINPQFLSDLAANEPAAARRDLQVSPDQTVVATVGIFSPRKCPEKVLDLAEALHRSGRDPGQRWAVRLIGEVATAHAAWFQRAVVDRIARLRANGVDAALVDGRNSVAALMPGIDLLVLTSQSEGMPNVCMEALAAGTPVVALALPALDEWDDKVNAVAGACVLAQVPRGDPEIGLMAHAVSRVARSAPSRDLIASGMQDVFSAEAASRQLAECISGIELRVQ